MATDQYERGFLAGMELGRLATLTCYQAIDNEAMRFKDYRSGELLRAIAEAEADPDTLRRCLLAAWHERPRPSAEVVDLDAWRKVKETAA
jgi:hypothetical protein